MSEEIRSRSDGAGSISVARHKRVVIMLVAMCCLSLGVAIGAIVRGIAGAGSEDNHLTISNAPITPDALSAAFARVAGEVEPCVVNIKVYQGEEHSFLGREGTGSGVIVNPTGYIITNQHVIKQATKIRVKLASGSEFDARVIGQDPETDLAVIKIPSTDALPTARMGDSDKLQVGDWVLAIGSPFGLDQTVTAGIISAKDRVTDNGSTLFQQFLQTDAAINPGNSGGPLVNLAGEVVGINTQIATNSGVFNGIGFALPSSTAVPIYNQLVENGRVRRGFLGVQLSRLTPQIARLNGIADNQGVVVQELTSDSSPAGQAGIQSGDVITKINGEKVRDVRDLVRRVGSLPVGSSATVTYVREGREYSASVKLEERKTDREEPLELRPVPFNPRRPEVPDKPKAKPTLGLSVQTLTPELARSRGADELRGAVVTGVEPGSLADKNEIEMDDVVVQINGRPVASAEDFTRLTRDLKSGDDVVMRILKLPRRGGRVRAQIISFTMP